MPTGWRHLPEEIITRIADFLPLKAKLNLAACAKREQRSVAKSKLCINSILVDLTEEFNGVEVEEMDGTITAVIADSPDRSREAYLEIVAYAEKVLSFTKEPVKEFTFSGELVSYGDIFRIRKLISAPKIMFVCDDNQWKFWTLLIPYGTVQELTVESSDTNDFSELELVFVPCFKWIRKLTLNKFGIVDCNRFKRCEKIEEIEINSWITVKNLERFFARWCDSKLAPTLRMVTITDGGFWNQLIPFRRILRNDMRTVKVEEDPTPCETFVIRRKSDGALADLELSLRHLRFSFDPEKYEKVYSWPVGSDEEGFLFEPVLKKRSEEPVAAEN